MFDPNKLDLKIAESNINAEEVEEEAMALQIKLLENHEFDKSRYYLENRLSERRAVIKKKFTSKIH